MLEAESLLHCSYHCTEVTSPASGDIHICGACKSQFIDIESFLRHKRLECNEQVQTRPTLDGAATCEPLTLNKNTIEETVFDSQSGSQPQRTVKTTANKKARNGNKYKCHYDGCPYSSAYPKDVQRHLRIHTGERPYVCNICNKTFNRSDKFKAHERHHQGLKPYKCNQCNYATSDGSSLKKHLRIHSDERPFRCQICPYASRNSSQLVVHLRTHTGDAPFECPTCQTKFKINSDLKRHLRMHTGERPYKCSMCNYTCAIKGNLKTHIRLNHSTDNIQHCKQCEFTSPSRKLLHQHEKTHAPKPLHCTYPDCTYSCTSQVSLRNHNRIHNSDRPFRCDFCPYTSRQPGNVRFHMKKKHPEKVSSSKKVVAAKAPHTQPSITAPTPSTLNTFPPKPNAQDSDSNAVKGQQQQRNVRSRPLCIRSFKCHLCEAAFVREDSLRCHIRQHKQLTETQSKSIVHEAGSSSSATSAQQRPLDGDCMIERALQQSGVTTSTDEEPLQNHCETLLAASTATETTSSTVDQFMISNEVSKQTETLATVLNPNPNHINHIPSTTQILYQVQPGFQFVPYKPPLEPSSSSTATVQYILQPTDSGCSAPIFFNASPSALGPCPTDPIPSQPQLINYILGTDGPTSTTDQVGSMMTSGRTLLLSTGQVISSSSQCSTVFVHPGNVVAAPNSTCTGVGGGGVTNVSIVQPAMPSSNLTSATSTASQSSCSTSFGCTISDQGILMTQQSCLPIDNRAESK